MTSPDSPFFSDRERERLFDIVDSIDPVMSLHYRDEVEDTRSGLVFAHLVWIAQLYVDLLQTELPPVDIEDPDSFRDRVGLTPSIVTNALGGISDYLTDPSLRTGGEYPVRTPGQYGQQD